MSQLLRNLFAWKQAPASSMMVLVLSSQQPYEMLPFAPCKGAPFNCVRGKPPIHANVAQEVARLLGVRTMSELSWFEPQDSHPHISIHISQFVAIDADR